MCWIWLLMGAACAAMAAVIFGVAYRKKRGRAICVAQATETLPIFRNRYVQSRLQTALSCEERFWEGDIKLLYTQKLLYALSERSITGADGLTIQRMQSEVNGYSVKGYFTAQEKERITRTLTDVLCLCARYGIEG